MKEIDKIETDLEEIAATTALFLNERDDARLDQLREWLDRLETDVSDLLSSCSPTLSEKHRLLLPLVAKIILKLKDTLVLMESIKDEKPVCVDLDLPLMTEILIRNLKRLLELMVEGKAVDKEQVNADLQQIECLQDQHTRVLITYLMQNWRGIKEVMQLMKIAEQYKTACQELADLYSLL